MDRPGSVDRQGSRTATAGGLAAIALWSTTFAVARSVTEQVGPFRAAAGIYTVSGAAALVALLASRERRVRLRNAPIGPTLVCGVLFVGYMAAIYLAVGLAHDRPQTLVVALLNYLWPPLTIIFSIGLLRARASLLLLPATVLAVTGVYFVLLQGQEVSPGQFVANLASNPLAYGLAAAAAVAWALYSNLTRRWGGGASGSIAGVYLVCTAVVMASLASLSNEAGHWNARAAGEALFLGLANYFGYTLWDRAMRAGNLTFVAAASYATPLLSTLISCVYLGVLPGAGLLVGSVLLACGSIMSWMSVKPLRDR